MPTDVTSKIGATNSPVTMDYSTLQAWEDACPANLVSDDKRWIGECYDQGVLTTTGYTLTISGITTDSTRYVYLKCAAGASFKDKAGVRSSALVYNESNGVAVSSTTSSYYYTIKPDAQYTRIEGLQVKSDGWPIYYNGSGASNFRVADCIFESSARACLDTAGAGATGMVFTNSLFRRTSAGDVLMFYNVQTFAGCTIIGTGTSVAINNLYGSAASTIKNCAAFGCSTFSSNLASTNVSYNATDLASATGSNNQTSLTFANQFENSSNDFRAKSTGNLQAGTPDSTNTPNDITGLTRDATTPWIGCWEVAGGGGATTRPRSLLTLGCGC